jgi:hypothetical protein
MSAEREISITLSDTQVAQVVRAARETPGLVTLLAGVSDLAEMRRVLGPLFSQTKGSHSTLRSLLVLAAFPADGGERELADVAKALDLSPSTTHRYVRTWTELGLLEQDPISRRYRRALDANSGFHSPTCGEG